MSKPQPGVCGVCGRAMFRPGAIPHNRLAQHGRAWAEGHLYEMDPQRGIVLVRVLCNDHRDRSDMSDARNGWGDVTC